MALALTGLEKRLRRMERTRLQAFLRSGGILIKEDMPGGVVAWCRATRSGHPFSNRCVTRLLKRGTFVYRKVGWAVFASQDGLTVLAEALG